MRTPMSVPASIAVRTMKLIPPLDPKPMLLAKPR